MTVSQINSLNLNIDTTDNKAVLRVEAAVEWLADNTTIDTTDIENLPACAKLFIDKFIEINSMQSGIASESIEGLSQSFKSDKTEDMIWDNANQLLSSYLKSRVRFVPATKKWR